MSLHTCSAKTTSKTKCKTGAANYPKLYLFNGIRYCSEHLPAGARKAMQVNCTHSFVDPATGGECTYCGALVPFTPS